MHTDGRMYGPKDMTKLTDAFRNFSNAPKIYPCIRAYTDPLNSNPVYHGLNLLVITNCLTRPALSVVFSLQY